ncbi:MAG TPA: transglycosylase SLT domain-containing protein, partial [Elusimicrobiota bacterium]|nr:transglycosylase SLT domain-containing protein [Elusimicrobiota bacterium]
VLRESDIPATDQHLYNVDDWATLLDGLFKTYRFTADDKTMDRLREILPHVYAELKNLNEPDDLPNVLSTYIEPVTGRLFPYHRELMFDPEIGYRADRNLMKKVSLAVFYALELQDRMDRAEAKGQPLTQQEKDAWLKSRMDSDLRLFAVAAREHRGEPVDRADQEAYLRLLRSRTATWNRFMFRHLTSSEKAAYRKAAREVVERFFPGLSSLADINAGLQSGVMVDGRPQEISELGDLKQESLYRSLMAFAVARNMTPRQMVEYMGMVQRTFLPEVERYLKDAGMSELAQLPDSDRLRFLNKWIHELQAKQARADVSPADKAELDQTIRKLRNIIEIELQNERSNMVFATTLFWADQFMRDRGYRDPRAALTDEDRARLGANFKDFIDKLVQLRESPVAEKYVRMQLQIPQNVAINWLSTDAQGMLSAITLDWMKEKWTMAEVTAHLNNVIYAAENLTDEFEKYAAAVGLPQSFDTHVSDPLERVRVWGELAARTRMLEKVLTLEIENGALRRNGRKVGSLADITGEDLSYVMDKLNRVYDAAQKNGISLEDGEGQYFYELLHGLRQDMDFVSLDLGINGEIERFFADYAAAKRASRNAGAALLREYATQANLPEWMSPAERKLFFYYITGHADGLPNREGLMHRKVMDGDAVFKAAKYMRLRGFTEQDLVAEEKAKMYLQAIYMLLHTQDGVPRELSKSDLSSYLNMVTRGLNSLEEIGLLFKYDSISEGMEEQNAAALGGQMPRLSKAQRFGLGSRMLQLGQGANEIRAWFRDMFKIQRAAREGLGDFLAPQALSALIEPFRRNKPELNDYLEGYTRDRFNSTAREDVFLMDLGEEAGLLRRVLLTHLTTEGELPSKERTNQIMEWWRDLEGRLRKERNLDAGAVVAYQQEFAELMAQAKQTFMDLLAPAMYERNPQGNLHDDLQKEVARMEEFLAPRLIDYLVRYEARQKAVKLLLDESARERSVLEPIQDRLKAERAARVERYRAELQNEAAKKTALLELDRLARTSYGMNLDEGEKAYYLKKMKELGYTPEEVLFRFIHLKDLVAQTMYGRTELTEQEKGVVAAFADDIFDRFGFMSAGDRQAMEKGLGLTRDEAVARDVAKIRRQLDYAVKIRGLYREMGLPISESKSRSLAADAIAGAVELPDIRQWLEFANLVRDIGEAHGLPRDRDTLDDLLFSSDIFKLGLADLPTKEIVRTPIDEKQLEAQIVAEMARMGIELTPYQLPALVQRMKERRISPVALRMYGEKMQRVERMMEEARRADAEKSVVDDMTKAPRGYYDLNLGMRKKWVLALLDHLNPNTKTHIGIVDILGPGYDAKILEKRMGRPIFAMYSQMVRDELMRRLPESLWQRNWSEFEKWRYNAWKQKGWGNIQNIMALGAIAGTVKFAFLLFQKFFGHRKMSKEQRKELTLSWSEVLFFTMRTVITATLLTGGVVLSLNFSYFNAARLTLFVVVTWYMTTIVADKYILLPIIWIGAHVFEPFKKLQTKITGKESSFIHLHRRKDIMEAGRIPDSTPLKLILSDFVSFDKEEPSMIKKNSRIEYDFILQRQTIPLLIEDYLRAKKAGGQQNLYYNMVLQSRGSGPRGDATDKEHEIIKHFLKERLEELLTAKELSVILRRDVSEEEAAELAAAVKRRTYIFLRRTPVKKPFMQYVVHRWFMETDEEYQNVTDPLEQELNVDPVNNPDGTVDKSKRVPMPLEDVLFGDPSDPRDLRNLRQRNIASHPDPMHREREGEFDLTLTYDMGNEVDYDGLLRMAATAADERNEAYMYRCKMVFNDVYSSLHTFIMKYFPLDMLNFMMEAQQYLFKSVRAPGKYMYRDRDYYRKLLKTQAYEKIWPFYTRLKSTNDVLPKSEDEVHTILAGKMAYVGDVDMSEDPQYFYLQEAARDETKWSKIFDWPQLFVFRLAPSVRDHPWMTAFKVGWYPAFAIAGLLGASMTYFVWIPILVGLASALTVGLFLFKPASRKLRAMEASGKMWIPRMSPGHMYESNMVLRGQITEPIWFLQLAVTFIAMLRPGNIEVHFPFLGEILFTFLMILLTMPKLFPSIAALLFGKKLPGYDEKDPEANKPRKIDWLLRIPRAIGYVLLGNLEFSASQSYTTKVVRNPFIKIMQIKDTAKIVYYHIFRPNDPPPPAPWIPASLGDKSPNYLKYLWFFRWPFAVGLAVVMITILPLLTSYGTIRLIGMGGALVLAAAFHIPRAFDPKLKSSPLLNRVGTAVSSALIAVLLAYVGLHAQYLNTVLPFDSMLRAATIFVSSFLFAPARTWLEGKEWRDMFGEKWGRRAVRWGAYTLGFVVLASSILGIFFPTDCATWVSAVFAGPIPMGDGSASLYAWWLPMQENLRLPWFFVVFFTSILVSSVVIGVVATVAGVISGIAVGLRNVLSYVLSGDIRHELAKLSKGNLNVLDDIFAYAFMSPANRKKKRDFLQEEAKKKQAAGELRQTIDRHLSSKGQPEKAEPPASPAETSAPLVGKKADEQTGTKVETPEEEPKKTTTEAPSAGKPSPAVGKKSGEPVGAKVEEPEKEEPKKETTAVVSAADKPVAAQALPLVTPHPDADKKPAGSLAKKIYLALGALVLAAAMMVSAWLGRPTGENRNPMPLPPQQTIETTAPAPRAPVLPPAAKPSVSAEQQARPPAAPVVPTAVAVPQDTAASLRAERDNFLSRAKDQVLLEKMEESALSDYEDFIQAAARENGLDPDVIRAIILQESRGKAGLVSKRGAHGLMQLLSRFFGGQDLKEPKRNIEKGSAFYRSLLATYNNGRRTPLAAEELAWAAYNAGPTTVNLLLEATGDPRSATLQDIFDDLPLETQRHQVGILHFLVQLKGGAADIPSELDAKVMKPGQAKKSAPKASPNRFVRAKGLFATGLVSLTAGAASMSLMAGAAVWLGAGVWAPFALLVPLSLALSALARSHRTRTAALMLSGVYPVLVGG